MKTTLILFIFMLAIGLGFGISVADAKNGSLPAKLLANGGKTYTGPQDPEFIAYDKELRGTLVSRIKKEFGITLDPKAYNGFELLEIEALLKCRKSNESPDLILGRFKKRQ